MSDNLAPKAVAHYRDHPNDGKHCSLCTMFRAPDHCSAVAGLISPQGWCEYFHAKMRNTLTRDSKLKPEHTLVVIRHGSTALNGKNDRIRGWTDVPLSDDGIKEVEQSAPALRKHNLHGLVTSDLQRASHTADIISKKTGVPVIAKTSDLRPWHLGKFTGQPTEDILPEMQEYIRDKPNEPVPGGESFNQFKQRFLAAVLRIQNSFPHQKIGIVTHHRGERLLEGWKQAGRPTDPAKIAPHVFMHKGIAPGDFVAHEIAPKEKTKFGALVR